MLPRRVMAIIFKFGNFRFNSSATEEIFCRLDFSRIHVGVGRLDPKNLIRIFLVAYRDVAVLNQFRHDVSCFLPPLPELGAVIQIAGNRQALFLGFEDPFQAHVAEGLADRRRDSRPVKPVRVFKDPVPVHHASFYCRNGRTVPVIDHLAAPLDRSVLKEIDADSAAPPEDLGRPHAETPEIRNAGISKSLSGKRVTKSVATPYWASETETFASPPPKVASNELACRNRRNPGGLSRSMISPKVTTFFTFPGLPVKRFQKISLFVIARATLRPRLW